MTFFVCDLAKETDGDSEPFSSYLFEVQANGFRKVYGNCRDDFISNVFTWRSIMT